MIWRTGLAAVLILLGTFGARAQDAVLPSLRSLLFEQTAACFQPDSSMKGTVRLGMRLARDGSLDGRPQVLSRPTGATGERMESVALRAVRRCAPFRLPAEHYDAWREVVVTFDFSTE